jgi:hypothetical protein
MSWLYRKKELAYTAAIELYYFDGLGNGEKESANRVLVSFNK